MSPMSIISFLIKNYKYIFIGALFFGFGAYSAWHIQAGKIKKLQAQNLKVQSQLQECVKINKSNQDTISELSGELEKANKLCTSRIRIREKTIQRLQQIDKLKGGSNEKNTAGLSDSILPELNKLFNNADSGSYQLY